MPRPDAALCADAAALRASLDKLTHVKVGKVMASEITTSATSRQN
jgi:hypothetical protein